MFDIRDIILLILIIIVIYLLYKDTTKEKFDIMYDADIRTAVNNQYKIDVDSMRNLGKISEKILSDENTLTLPAKIIIPETLTIKKDLIVEGNVKFTNINNNINLFDIFPRYTIIAYANINFPKGWVLCDGARYYPENHRNQFTRIDSSLYGQFNDTSINTPDLLSRCIIGAGFGATNIGNNISGGNKEYTLKEANMPSHSHNMFVTGTGETGKSVFTWNGTDGRRKDTNVLASGLVGGNSDYSLLLTYAITAADMWTGKTSLYGSDNPTPISLMQPYCALYYIMKLY